MAFRFPLAAVLRLREIEEEREERMLTQLLARIGEAKEQLAAVESEIVDALAGRERTLSQGMPVTELHTLYARVKMLEEHKAKTEATLASLEQQRVAQIAAYRSAHQRREVLSTMRQQQRERFAGARARQEQKMLDDIFLARLGRL